MASDRNCVGGFTESYGSIFATPGVAEKGYLDVKVDVAAPGGHSSVPPAHTVSNIIASVSQINSQQMYRASVCLLPYSSKSRRTHLCLTWYVITL